MRERLVDVLNANDTVLHVFPIATDGRGGPPGDAECMEGAVRAEQRRRTRAHFLWQQECCPGGRAEEHWHRACEAEGHDLPG